MGLICKTERKTHERSMVTRMTRDSAPHSEAARIARVATAFASRARSTRRICGQISAAAVKPGTRRPSVPRGAEDAKQQRTDDRTQPVADPPGHRVEGHRRVPVLVVGDRRRVRRPQRVEGAGPDPGQRGKRDEGQVAGDEAVACGAERAPDEGRRHEPAPAVGVREVAEERLRQGRRGREGEGHQS